jgi:hypothetical protein
MPDLTLIEAPSHLPPPLLLATRQAWGPLLWRYLNKVADAKPQWTGQFVVFPDKPNGNFTTIDNLGAHARKRLAKFHGGRNHVFYDETLQVRCSSVGTMHLVLRPPPHRISARPLSLLLQAAHHIHFPAEGEHRILQVRQRS